MENNITHTSINQLIGLKNINSAFRLVFCLFQDRNYLADTIVLNRYKLTGKDAC